MELIQQVDASLYWGQGCNAPFLRCHSRLNKILVTAVLFSLHRLVRDEIHQMVLQRRLVPSSFDLDDRFFCCADEVALSIGRLCHNCYSLYNEMLNKLNFVRQKLDIHKTKADLIYFFLFARINECLSSIFL